MQVFEENLNLKEKMREFEVDDVKLVEFNAREKIEHNLIFLMEVNQKIEESIGFRKKIEEKIEKLAYLSGLSPEELENHREENKGGKILKKQIEGLNFEKISLKQKVSEMEQRAFNLEEQLEDKEAQMARMEEERETLAANYEKRIKELKEGFQEKAFSGAGKGSVDSLRQSLLNAKDEIESEKKRVADLEDKLRYQENQFALTIKQKEDMINLNRNALERLRDESEGGMGSMKKQAFEGSMEMMHDEMNGLQREKHKLSKKVAELIKEQDNFRHNLEKALEDKYRLQNELNEVKDDGETAQKLREMIKKLEIDVEREVLEKKKLMGELETIQDSYAYSLSQISKLKKQAEKQKESITLGRSRSRSRSRSRKRSNEGSKKSGKMSARRLKFKTAVDNIQDTLFEERNKIREMEILLEGNKAELKNLTNEYDDLDKRHIKLQERASEDREALEELKNKLDSKENEISDLNQSLKEEISKTRTQKMQILDLQNEATEGQKATEEHNIEQKQAQDKIIALQQKISEKMDEIHNTTEKLEKEKMKNFDTQKQLESEKDSNFSLKSEIKCLKEINKQLSEKIQEISNEMESINNRYSSLLPFNP